MSEVRGEAKGISRLLGRVRWNDSDLGHHERVVARNSLREPQVRGLMFAQELFLSEKAFRMFFEVLGGNFTRL